jgi:Fe2+ transport system protein FeoA
MGIVTREQVHIVQNNSFGDKWKIEIGVMEKRKKQSSF